LFVADIVTAQTTAYRQANLASNLSNVANNVTPGLADPWGIAFLTDQPFFLADNHVGRVTAHDASGLGVRPGSFTVPNSVEPDSTLLLELLRIRTLFLAARRW